MIINNSAGTISSQFSIGKQIKTTLYVDDVFPSNSFGNNSDIYVDVSSGTFFFKKDNVWAPIKLDVIKTETISTSSFTIANDTTFVRVNAPIGGTTITLPAGIDGKQIVIKDIGKNSSVRNINIVPNGSETIDDTSSVVLALDNASLSILFYDNDWSII